MKKTLTSILALLLIVTMCCSAFADNVLRPGDKGDAVKEAQTWLKAYGYYTGKIDGVYGDATTKAVRHFQQNNDLTMDGKIGSKTRAILTSGGAVPASAKPAPTEPATANTAAEIKAAQTLLKQYGYYGGKLNGKLDSATKEAIKNFQHYNKLTENGKLDTETLTKLNGSDVVKAPIADKETANKEDVKHVQERLAYYGYYTMAIDGLYGNGTIAAVKAFQKANGLPVDGVVGKKTLAKLDATDSVKKQVVDDTKELEEHPTLRKGDKGKAVKELQKLLKAAGVYSGNIDGTYGTETVKAVKAYQKANGLKEDGKCGPFTWAKLLGIDIKTVYPDATEKPDDNVLRWGDKGEAVKALQQKLRQLGYKIAADGIYGEKTVLAVRKFQVRNNLKEDGKVGPATMAVIDAKLAE